MPKRQIKKQNKTKKKHMPRHGAIWGLSHGLDGMKPARCWREIGKETCLHIRISPKNWFEVVCWICLRVSLLETLQRKVQNFSHTTNIHRACSAWQKLIYKHLDMHDQIDFPQYSSYEVCVHAHNTNTHSTHMSTRACLCTHRWSFTYFV